MQTYNWFQKISKRNDYSCVLAPLPKTISAKIKSWGGKKIPNGLLSDVDSLGRENNIHTTIKYGIHTNKISLIKNILFGTSSFDIVLGNVSRFTSNDAFDVVKIDIDECPDLYRLNELLTRNLDNTDTHREYRPHVTIAYVKKGACVSLSGDTTFKEQKVKIDRLNINLADGNTDSIDLG